MAQTLEQRANYIRTFAAHVSHEFKTPLTAIQGAVELLRDHAEGMSEQERQRFLGNLQEDSMRLDRLVRRLLELARADVITPGEETADVLSVVKRVVDRYIRQGLRIQIQQSTDVPAVAIADDTLDSILTNLIDNAIQHAGKDPRIGLRVATDASEGQLPRVILHVEDDGPGISAAKPRAYLRTLFHHLAQARRHRARTVGGQVPVGRARRRY